MPKGHDEHTTTAQHHITEAQHSRCTEHTVQHTAQQHIHDRSTAQPVLTESQLLAGGAEVTLQAGQQAQVEVRRCGGRVQQPHGGDAVHDSAAAELRQTDR